MPVVHERCRGSADANADPWASRIPDAEVIFLRQLEFALVPFRFARRLQRLPNGEIFRKAGREQRIVLTFDLDFGEILAGSGSETISVVLFRLHNTRADFVIPRLGQVLNDSSADLLQGAIVVVEDARHRVRKLPVGS
jgi:predicted nuclease of predicted toxin-antitoxin system